MEDIVITTSNKSELIDITFKISEIISKSNIKSGLCTVYCPHTTAGLTINENADPDVKTDILMWLNKMVPENPEFKHSEGNSPGHIKSSLLGNSLTILIENGNLVLGTWQGIMFFEGDGPRNRKVLVDIIKK